MKKSRVMLKLSGEALAFPNGGGYNEDQGRYVHIHGEKAEFLKLIAEAEARLPNR